MPVQVKRPVKHSWEALGIYAETKNWQSPSTGFALQYDPTPAPIHIDRGNAARAALTAAKEVQAQVEPCDMGEMCLNCQPRGPNGECPDKATPQAQRLTPDELQRIAYNTRYHGIVETCRVIETAFAAKNGIHLGD